MLSHLPPRNRNSDHSRPQCLYFQSGNSLLPREKWISCHFACPEHIISWKFTLPLAYTVREPGATAVTFYPSFAAPSEGTDFYIFPRIEGAQSNRILEKYWIMYNASVSIAGASVCAGFVNWKCSRRFKIVTSNSRRDKVIRAQSILSNDPGMGFFSLSPFSSFLICFSCILLLAWCEGLFEFPLVLRFRFKVN